MSTNIGFFLKQSKTHDSIIIYFLSVKLWVLTTEGENVNLYEMWNEQKFEKHQVTQKLHN